MHGIEIDNENKKARIEEEIDELKAKLDDKKKELSAKEEEIQSKKSNNDDDTFISKAETEKKSIEKELKNLENQINSKRKEMEKTNTEQQSSDGSSLEVFNTKGNKKNTKPATSKQQFEIRKLPQLPQVGKLFTSGGHSYLAIEFWEDYELGEIEAERLKAKLCATK